MRTKTKCSKCPPGRGKCDECLRNEIIEFARKLGYDLTTPGVA